MVPKLKTGFCGFKFRNRKRTRGCFLITPPSIFLPHCLWYPNPSNLPTPLGKKVKSLSCVWLFATPWTVAYHTPPSMGSSRQEYWSGLPFPFPEDLPDPGIKPQSPHCRQVLYGLKTTREILNLLGSHFIYPFFHHPSPPGRFHSPQVKL